MAPTWLAGTFGLLGVVIGGVINFMATRAVTQRQTEWDRRQLLREKLEEIAELADAVDSGFRHFVLESTRGVLEGRLPRLDTSIPFERLRMLVAFYAPELNDDLERVIATRDQLGPEFADVIAGEKDDAGTKKKVVGDLMNTWREMHAACDELVSGAAREARKKLDIP